MTYTFRHVGKPHPQGRPKITTVPFPKVYYSGTSTKYRKELVKAFEARLSEIIDALALCETGDVFPLPCAEVHLYVWGLRRNADGDNMLKQVLDALVTAGVIEGDEWTRVPFVTVRCMEGPGKIKVEVIPTTIEYAGGGQ